MKHFICILVMSVITNSFVQTQNKTFLRFYDAFGHKFEKGYYVRTTDSSIIVHRDSTTLEITITRIFTVKTRRSVGHNILVSSFIEAIPLTIYAVSTGEPHTNEDTFSGILHDAYTFTPLEAGILGVFGGMVGGTITGVLLSGKGKIQLIDGKMENWNQLTGRIIRKKIEVRYCIYFLLYSYSKLVLHSSIRIFSYTSMHLSYYPYVILIFIFVVK